MKRNKILSKSSRRTQHERMPTTGCYRCVKFNKGLPSPAFGTLLGGEGCRVFGKTQEIYS
jgi:hypothetical protein